MWAKQDQKKSLDKKEREVIMYFSFAVAISEVLGI